MATDDQILAAYEATGSVHRAGDLLGMHGQSVHKRLVKMGKNRPLRRLTEGEKDQIEAFYREGFTFGDGTLQALAAKLGRTVPFVVRFAGHIGLTNPGRSRPAECMASVKAASLASFAVNGHPRGMLGKKHTQETKDVIAADSAARAAKMTAADWRNRAAKTARTNLVRYGTTLPNFHGRGSWRAAWREIGGVRKFFRSRWEANFSRYLQWKKERGEIAAWEHEAETFWFKGIKRGSVSYLPDFRVTELDGSRTYYEVKGWMDNRSATKLRRMAKYHPEIKLVVIREPWFKENGPTLAVLIEGWELKERTA